MIEYKGLINRNERAKRCQINKYVRKLFIKEQNQSKFIASTDEKEPVELTQFKEEGLQEASDKRKWKSNINNEESRLMGECTYDQSNSFKNSFQIS